MVLRKKTYAAIIADFSKLKDRLHAHVEAKGNESVKLLNEIGALEDKRQAADTEAAMARNAVAKLSEIFGDVA